MSHRRELEPRQFESLCGMQCSVDELCGWFGCDEAALDAWCMEQYGESFTQAFDRLKTAGRILLRQAQVVAAKKNPTMSRYLEGRLARQEKPAEKARDYSRTKAYRDLRESLLRCLALRGIDEDLYRDKVQEYMDFWVRRQELRDDISKRGLTVMDDRGRLSENRSVSLEIQVSRQMLAIFASLGFKEDALSSGSKSEDDDEL